MESMSRSRFVMSCGGANPTPPPEAAPSLPTHSPVLFFIFVGAPHPPHPARRALPPDPIPCRSVPVVSSLCFARLASPDAAHPDPSVVDRSWFVSIADNRCVSCVAVLDFGDDFGCVPVVRGARRPEVTAASVTFAASSGLSAATRASLKSRLAEAIRRGRAPVENDSSALTSSRAGAVHRVQDCHAFARAEIGTAGCG